MSPDPSLTTTRTSLHMVAEHVLSPVLHAATGRIGLRQSPGGFATPEIPVPGGSTRRVAVDGVELVIHENGGLRRSALSTLRMAAEFVGIEPGAPAEVYAPVTPLDLDTDLVLDDGAARRIADWYALVQQALERLAGDLASHAPAPIQLWPEHFDLATTIAEVNFGGSPGDEHQEQPYLYVGPWNPPEPDGGFWNESFGASRTDARVRTIDDAVAFLHEGWERCRAL